MSDFLTNGTENDPQAAITGAIRAALAAGLDLSDETTKAAFSAAIKARLTQRGGGSLSERAGMAVNDLLTEQHQAAKVAEIQRATEIADYQPTPADWLKIGLSKPAAPQPADQTPGPNATTAELLRYGLRNPGATLPTQQQAEPGESDISQITDPGDLFKLHFSKGQTK
jgi:hypothetical protein